ncbi:MAG: thiamine phosphate synthase [Victivallales bacterium]|nr:thiamine phosphate synthase [Victivallales bacterium]
MKTKAERISAFRNIDLYPVISSEFTAGRPVLDILKAVADGGARIVQLREKNLPLPQLWRLAEQYRDLTSRYEMLLMIDDHADIALAVGADGVHLGQDDLPLAAAVKLHSELLIGHSTHNREEAAAAIRGGADCINIGPIFPTGTKNVSYPVVGMDNLKQIAAAVTVPFSVMGGIKAGHIPALLRAGASRIAMVTGITQAEDVTARVRALRALWLDHAR